MARKSSKSTRTTKRPYKKWTRQRLKHQWVTWIPRDERRVAAVTRTFATARGKTKRKVPSITLSGEWLRKAGFPVDAAILIMVQQRGQVIIDLLDQ